MDVKTEREREKDAERHIFTSPKSLCLVKWCYCFGRSCGKPLQFHIFAGFLVCIIIQSVFRVYLIFNALEKALCWQFLIRLHCQGSLPRCACLLTQVIRDLVCYIYILLIYFKIGKYSQCLAISQFILLFMNVNCGLFPFRQYLVCRISQGCSFIPFLYDQKQQKRLSLKHFDGLPFIYQDPECIEVYSLKTGFDDVRTCARLGDQHLCFIENLDIISL